jgi:hypothetical protein
MDTRMSTEKSSKCSKTDWGGFKTYKQRGEWVELQFMAEAAKHRFAVNKPWGTQAYDVGIEHGSNFLRVQVKSTTHRADGGYRCMFRPRHRAMQRYDVNEIDLFAAYVIPLDAPYLIPATLIVGAGTIPDAMLCPVELPVKKRSYRYECYREAWKLLTKTRAELAKCTFAIPSSLLELCRQESNKGKAVAPARRPTMRVIA